MEYSKLKDAEVRGKVRKEHVGIHGKPTTTKKMGKPLPIVPSIMTNKSHATGKNEASRTAKEHSFLTDVADVRQMEQGLLQLLEDFHSGKLQAFGQECSFEKMDQVREQQERLARLHFELDSQQELHGLESEEARKNANENLAKLVDNLHELSLSIHNLQKGNESKDIK